MILNKMYSLSMLCYTVWVTFLLLYCFWIIPLFGFFQSFLYSTHTNKVLVLLLFCFSPHCPVNWMHKFPGPLCCRSLGKKMLHCERVFQRRCCVQNTGRWVKTHGYYSFSPWLSSSLTAPPMLAPVTFASIVEEELQQEAALIRSREKPLALIQVKSVPK